MSFQFIHEGQVYEADSRARWEGLSFSFPMVSVCEWMSGQVIPVGYLKLTSTNPFPPPSTAPLATVQNLSDIVGAAYPSCRDTRRWIHL
jgi:hypothetical protein